eukprot:403368911
MIKTPVNQIRLTNVAVIRLKKGGKKFEIACYKNKAVNWRNKQESNLSEVLQIDQIFTNVSKGEVAKQKDLQAVFGKMTQDEIVIEILNKGELQVSELERDEHLDSLKKEIANIIAQKCVNTSDGKQFPVSIIMKAMNEANVKINPKDNAKKQALTFIPDLKNVIPIDRAKMRLKISFERQDQLERLKEVIERDYAQDYEVERIGEKFMQCQIQPNMFRELNNIVKDDKQFYSGVTIEIQEQQVMQETGELDEQMNHLGITSNNEEIKQQPAKVVVQDQEETKSQAQAANTQSQKDQASRSQLKQQKKQEKMERQTQQQQIDDQDDNFSDDNKKKGKKSKGGKKK